MQKTILLVDDEVNILKALERLLRRSGYTVLTAESGFAALELMAQHDCHVVISDFRMPGMTGDQLLLNIKQDFPQCICMVLSGFADFNAVIGLLNSGSAFRFLQKPWDDDALLIEIELAFEEYHKRRNKKIRNQFLLSSREALLEVTMTGQLCRSNATAQQLLSMSGTELAVGNVSQLFSDLDTELLTQLLSRQKMGVQCQHQTRAIEVDVQMSDKHFALLRLQLAEELPLLVDSTVNLPQVLNQNGLIRKIYSLLQTNKTSALVALQIKDYHLINDIIGFVEAEQLFENIAGSLLSSMSKYGCLGYLANEQFILLFEKLVSEAELHQTIYEVLEPLTDMTLLNGRIIPINFSVAYCLAPEDGDSGRSLLNNALVTLRLNSKGRQTFPPLQFCFDRNSKATYAIQ